MLTALMHITSSQPHACSSHTELVLYLQRSLCFIQKKKTTRSRAFSLCSRDNQDSCEDEDVRASHLKPDKTPAGVCRFFFRPVVERGLCDFLLCACRPHLLQTRSGDRISVWNVKIFIMTHFILYSTFKVFFFSFHFFLSQKQVFGNLPAGVKIKSVTSVWLGSFHQVSVCFMRKCLNR